MKKAIFSPLTRIKKTGKISVLSYMAWRKFYKMPFSAFEINQEYKSFPLDEYVYTRKGEQLFFYNYKPSDIERKIEWQDYPDNWIAVWRDEAIYFGCRGLDCDGVPTFSNHTSEQVALSDLGWMEQYDPLTVKTVVMWLDWLMLNKVERINQPERL